MKTVLLVEDDHWIADCYQLWLRGFGYDVVWVQSAQQALDALDETAVDAIMLDIMLPHANGIHLLNVMASHVDLMHLPVVICSNTPPQASLQPYGVRAVLDKSTLTQTQLAVVMKGIFTHATVPN